MRSCYPTQLYQNSRGPDNQFGTDEKLYIRFQGIDEAGRVDEVDIKFPNQSTNREKHSQPHWVLCSMSCPEFLTWGFGFFLVRQVPASLQTEGGKKRFFRVEHKPVMYNYSHSEVRMYNDKLFKEEGPKKPKHGLKKMYRVRLRDVIEILREPDDEPYVCNP